MNVARIAALLRELADELEGEVRDEGRAEITIAEKRRKKVPRAPSWPAPLRPPSDLARMRAAKTCRRHGIG
jgi:hypothetical protein